MRSKRKSPSCKLHPPSSYSAFCAQTVGVWVDPASLQQKCVCRLHHISTVELKSVGCASSGLLCSCSKVEMAALKNEVGSRLQSQSTDYIVFHQIQIVNYDLNYLIESTKKSGDLASFFRGATFLSSTLVTTSASSPFQTPFIRLDLNSAVELCGDTSLPRSRR